MNDFSHEQRRMIGLAVAFIRQAQGLTQTDLSQKSGVDRRTIFALEKGKKVLPKTFETICSALTVDPKEVASGTAIPRLMDNSRPFFVHRAAEEEWFADTPLPGNGRLDYQTAIQEASERDRLGRLGLVPSFSHALSFLMPRGPGVVFVEVHGRTKHEMATYLYEDFLLICLRGKLKISLGETETVLGKHDALAASSWIDFAVEPCEEVGPDSDPPLLLVIGANRVGNRKPS